MRLEILVLLIYFLVESSWWILGKHRENYDNDDDHEGHLHTYSGPWEVLEDAKLYSVASPPCPEDESLHQRKWEPFRVRWAALNLLGFSDEARAVISQLLNETRRQFARLFMVQRSAYPIGLDQRADCNGAGEIFANHVLTERCNPKDPRGLHDADFMMYVTEKEKCGGGILASANDCKHLFNHSRATFGIISLCPGTIVTDDWNRLTLIKTLQHELLHTLGFNNEIIGQLEYVEGGIRKKGRQYFSRKWKINSNQTRNHEAVLITTPKVKAIVRNHFNCPDLEGAELENEGGGGTRLVHWEKRIFGGETMSGYISRRSYLSALTLAFFEDTGWFKPNYSLAEPFLFGAGAGCVFARNSCRDYLESSEDLMYEPGAAKPYCNWGDFIEKKRLKSTPRECSRDRQYYAACDWIEANAKDLNKDKTYFADQWTVVNGVNITGHNVYGYSEVLDGCPQWNEYWYGLGKTRIGDSVCINPYSQPRPQGNYAAELFGENSACFQQDGKFDVYDCLPFGISLHRTEQGHHGAGCYRYKCENGRLMIQANHSHDNSRDKLYMKQYKICWGEGTVIHIRRHQNSGANGKERFHKGIIICPSCKELCETGRWGNFTCKPDIKHLNSTDYSPLPCPAGTGRTDTTSALFASCLTTMLVTILRI